MRLCARSTLAQGHLQFCVRRSVCAPGQERGRGRASRQRADARAPARKAAAAGGPPAPVPTHVPVSTDSYRHVPMKCANASRRESERRGQNTLRLRSIITASVRSDDDAVQAQSVEHQTQRVAPAARPRSLCPPGTPPRAPALCPSARRGFEPPRVSAPSNRWNPVNWLPSWAL